MTPVSSANLALSLYGRVARKSSIGETLYGHLATSFLIVFVLRIVNGMRSTSASGTGEKSDVPGFLRRHQ